MLTKRFSMRIGLFMLLVLLMGAVHPVSAIQASKASINFYFFGDPSEETAYKSVIAAFNVKYPDVVVNPVVLPDGDTYLTRLTADFVANTPPDVFLINYREYVTYADKGVLEPVQTYLQKSKLVDVKNYYEPSIKAFTRGGEVQCMPQNTSSLVVYYNKDLFAKANVPLPSMGDGRAGTVLPADAVHLVKWRRDPG
jgi:multiple sugar transport system substrate-binding protein